MNIITAVILVKEKGWRRIREGGEREGHQGEIHGGLGPGEERRGHCHAGDLRTHWVGGREGGRRE